jgi:hypothetical protein
LKAYLPLLVFFTNKHDELDLMKKETVKGGLEGNCRKDLICMLAKNINIGDKRWTLIIEAHVFMIGTKKIWYF